MKIFQFNFYTNVYLITSFILGIILMGISFSGTNSIFLNLTGLFLILFFFVYILFTFIINKLNSKINWNKFFKPTKNKITITILTSFLISLILIILRSLFTTFGTRNCIDGLLNYKNLLLFFEYIHCFPTSISLFFIIINIIALLTIIYLFISLFFIKKTKIENEISPTFYRTFGEILILILIITLLISLIFPLSSSYYVNKYSKINYINYVDFENIPNPSVQNPISLENNNLLVKTGQEKAFGMKVLNALNEQFNLILNHDKDSKCNDIDNPILIFGNQINNIGEYIEVVAFVKTKKTILSEKNQSINCPIIIELNGKTSNVTFGRFITIHSR